jgi:hypothetical protein
MLTVHIHGNQWNGVAAPAHGENRGVFSPGHGDRQLAFGTDGRSFDIRLEFWQRKGEPSLAKCLLSVGFVDTVVRC